MVQIKPEQKTREVIQMQYECIMAGFGGQGIMSMGQFLAYSGMSENKQVVWLPSYGPEMRGGTAYCTVILSDTAIGSPVITSPLLLVVMNRPSLEKFAPRMKSKGTLFINSTLIDIKSDRKDIEQVLVPANQIAIELKSPKSANMAMLGAFIAKTGIVKLKTVQEILRKKFVDKKSLIDVNLEVLSKGYKYVNKS
jgi:2-oxoglutarate ferredoxin oxidoreductase subunit gamma